MSINICSCQDKLAEVLRDGGKDVDEAATLYKEILDYVMKGWGDQHPLPQLMASEYARCLELKGSRLEALEIYKKAYPIILKKWGKDDIDVKKVQSWIEVETNIDEQKE